VLEETEVSEEPEVSEGCTGKMVFGLRRERYPETKRTIIGRELPKVRGQARVVKREQGRTVSSRI
jgi:hypothetical protein